MTVSLLVRHRWLGYPALELWRCTPKTPSLWESPDPLCSGCRLELQWTDIANLRQYEGLANDPALAERLAVHLDMFTWERRGTA